MGKIIARLLEVLGAIALVAGYLVAFTFTTAMAWNIGFICAEIWDRIFEYIGLF